MVKNDLSTQQRNTIVQELLEDSKHGKPKGGKMSEVAAKFNISTKSISRLWTAAKKQKEAGQSIFVQSLKPNTPRRKKIHLDLTLVQCLDLLKRSTIRKLALVFYVVKALYGDWVKNGLIKAHTSSIKPDLTAPNKLLRLSFALKALEFDRIMNILKFKSMYNTIHIDEKWFYISKTAHKFYLTPEEHEPHRTCQNKKFISKIMFMCTVTRPLFDHVRNVLFDGKIDIFPLTHKVAAKRRSKNRAADTLQTKPIDSITKDVIKECLINQIISAIKVKWPASASRTIFIQQDNARPHIKDTDADFRNAASSDGFDIRIVHQPPNSPDTNVNDLGWFRAIQSIQSEKKCYGVDSLANTVLTSFEELSPMTLNKVFLSLQSCMVEIMKVKRQNSYKIPHMKKDSLIRQQLLPIDLEVSESLVRECLMYLMENGRLDSAHKLIENLGLDSEGQ